MSGKKSNKATSDLGEIYLAAWKEGIWLQEFAPGTRYIAAAGWLRDLKKLGKKLAKRVVEKILRNQLLLSDCVNLNSMPGIGPTREAACRNAIAQLKKHSNKNRA